MNNNKNYLTEHPQLIKKSSFETTPSRYRPEGFDFDTFTFQMMEKQSQAICNLQLRLQQQIKKNQLAKESLQYFQPQLEVAQLQARIEDLKRQTKYINQQIQSCQKIQSNTSPQEYFLWMKKQRIDTFDSSMGQLYLENEKKKEEVTKEIEDNYTDTDRLTSEIEELEDKIANLQPEAPYSDDSDQQENNEEAILFNHAQLKEQYDGLVSDIEALQQNYDIFCVQLTDGASQHKKNLYSYFQKEKIQLIRQLKQIQSQHKISQSEVAPLSADERQYKIEPLMEEYTEKLSEVEQLIKEQEIRSKVEDLLKPLPWYNFNWHDYLEINQKAEKTYQEFSELQDKCLQNQSYITKVGSQKKAKETELTQLQQKYQQLMIGILKMNRMLEK